MLEVQEQGEPQPGDVEVAEHLGRMGVAERGDDFRIGDHQAVHDQVGDQRADVLTVIRVPSVSSVVAFFVVVCAATRRIVAITGKWRQRAPLSSGRRLDD